MMKNSVKQRIEQLVKKGYKQAAFKSKESAMYYMKLWAAKGYTFETLRSSGPTVEEPNKRTLKAYYVIAKKKVASKAKAKPISAISRLKRVL